MAINFNVKGSNPDCVIDIKTRIHEALVGSPAYKNNEIAIVDGDTINDFVLCVGNLRPGHDISIELNLDSSNMEEM